MGVSIWQLIIVLILLPLAFLPTIIAIKKNHKYKIPIIIVNILGSFLGGIGWLIAFIWCFIEPKPSNTSNEIQKLHELKEKGALTQDEYDSKKRELLEQ